MSEPHGPLSLGIDVGTTSVKVVALGPDGTVIATGTSRHGIDDAVDGVQVDARTWWVSTLRALAGLQVDLGRVVTVGLSGNMSSVVIIDDEGEPIAPALLLADPRGGAQIAALDPTLRARITEASGNQPTAVFSLASLLWWSAVDHTRLERARAWLSAKDYLRLKLTGSLATEPTDAANSLLMGDTGWDTDLITAVGLDPRIFPPLLRSDQVAGHVTAAAAHATGVPAGTPVAAGAGDVAAGLVGMGGLAPDTLAVSLGTSVTLIAALGADGLVPHAARGALTRHPATDGTHFALGSLLTGGLALNWLRATAGDAAVVGVDPATERDERLVFLPYLAGTGSPDFVPGATGTIIGIRPTTTPHQLVTALLDAVAMDLADLVDRLDGRWRRVVVSGGGVGVPAWPQVIADALDLPVEVVAQSDLAVLGAARLGWSAVGRPVAPSPTTTVLTPRTSTTWPARRRRYQVARTWSLELAAALAAEEGTPA